jgi:hypothetical protein
MKTNKLKDSFGFATIYLAPMVLLAVATEGKIFNPNFEILLLTMLILLLTGSYQIYRIWRESGYAVPSAFIQRSALFLGGVVCVFAPWGLFNPKAAVFGLVAASIGEFMIIANYFYKKAH